MTITLDKTSIEHSKKDITLRKIVTKFALIIILLTSSGTVVAKVIPNIPILKNISQPMTFRINLDLSWLEQAGDLPIIAAIEKNINDQMEP